jgi:hypothetical protein
MRSEKRIRPTKKLKNAARRIIIKAVIIALAFRLDTEQQ